MKIMLSHPTGNSNVRAITRGLVSKDILYRFDTTIASFPGNFWNQLSRIPGLSDFSRRSFDTVLEPYTYQNWELELGRLISSKFGMKYLSQHEKGFFCIDQVYRSLDKKMSTILERESSKIDAIYAYEDGAILSFREAKRQKLSCYYDLPIGYWRSAQKLLRRELELWPEWASTISTFHDSIEKLAFKDEELELANRIFVASSFTAKTLEDFPGKLAPVSVIPYGFPEVSTDVKEKKYIIPRPLKLLFVGGLSQRKGIANLFTAVDKLLPHVCLTIVGRKATNDCHVLNKALSKHTWFSSLPHEEILRLMRNHDILVFPSLFEGFGLVITEAMSQGTPVITTDRTAGPDVIKNGENGWLIKAGSTQALVDCIAQLLESPGKIKEAGRAAMETARGRSWDVYGQELAEALLEENKYSQQNSYGNSL